MNVLYDCERCHKRITRAIAFGIVLSKGKFLRVCPSCYRIIYDAEIDKLDISKQAMAQSGLLDQGAEAGDIKNLLKKWAKTQTQNL